MLNFVPVHKLVEAVEKLIRCEQILSQMKFNSYSSKHFKRESKILFIDSGRQCAIYNLENFSGLTIKKCLYRN